MTIGFVVNEIMTEESGYTTTRLGWEAVNEGHEAFVFGVGDLAITFNRSVIGALELKVKYMSFYERNFVNVDTCTL